jgi:demethylmenaquinone methyltransferase / 2-methoxy-6-polyprenyl-1,4-benzoquinol methylase
MNTEDTKTDFGFQSVSMQEKTAKVADVFSSVADRYDLMNDLMSLGIHRWWKRHAVSCCAVRPGYQVLDLAGGSGDLTARISPLLGEQGRLCLADINADMLRVARRRLLDQGLYRNIDYVRANAESLPFLDNHFDRIMIGFGLRNVTDKAAALAAMYRVLKPGGRLVILEFSKPLIPLLEPFYDAYSFKVLPWLGELIVNDAASYRYLVESIRQHPDQETLKNMILTAGFECCDYQNLSGGIVALHQGIKY